jgi:hypothetical protein
MQTQKEKYANAYQYWSADDDKKLVELYNSGADIKTLMSVFRRNRGGIVSRINKLTK